MNLIFDTHAHYDDQAFDSDRDSLLPSLAEKNVCGAICCGSTLESSCKAVSLAEQYSFLWAAVGVHPIDAETASPGYLERLKELASHPRVVAIGEIGLDFHYDTPRPLQTRVLEEQLELAKKLGMPVILHDREAHGPMMELLHKHRPRGVIHCFSGSVEMMREAVSLGLFIGLGGAVTFKNAVMPPKVASAVPLDRLLLETDAPYMTPVPFRGKRCDSSYISYTAQKIAGLRGIDVNALYRANFQNTAALFGIQMTEP